MSVFRLSILALIFLGCFQAYAAKSISAEGRFYSRDDDSLSFCKRQLLFSAYQEIITKELTSMGLDSKLFWQRYDEKFDAYFSSIEINLKARYRIDEDPEAAKKLGKSELSTSKIRKNSVEYNKQLRTKRLKLRSRYMKLSSVIPSYKIRKMSRSTQYPNSRYISLNAKLDRKKLSAIYRKLTYQGRVKSFNTLYLTVDFSLAGAVWEDVGVEVKSDFENVVKEHWRKWLESALGPHVDNVILADDSIQRKLGEYVKLPAQNTESLNLLSNADKNSDLDWVKNSLWMKVKVSIKKNSEDILQLKREFSISGDIILTQLSDNTLIYHHDFKRDGAQFSYVDTHKLSSQMATMVYELPLGNLVKLKKVFAGLSVGQKTARLSLERIRNIDDIFAFEKLLQSKGITLQVSTHLDLYTGKNASLRVDYHGDESKFKAFLLSLRNEKISGRRVDFKDLDNPLVVIFMPKQDEKAKL